MFTENGKKAAVARLVVLVILVVNQFLATVFGWNPLPFTEEEIYAGVSAVLMAAQGIYVWYRNNNVTDEAQEAQKVLDAKKSLNDKLTK